MTQKTHYWFYGEGDIFFCIIFHFFSFLFLICLASWKKTGGAFAFVFFVWLVQYIILCFLNRGRWWGNIWLAIARMLMPLLFLVSMLISAVMLYAGLTESEDRKRNMAVGTVSGGVAVGLWQWLHLQCKDFK